jgi:RNA polymerase sigma-70 factor (ECF subfamily)
VRDDGFAAFFREVYPRVVGQLRLLTGDLASAEDVAQEAFVRAASRWAQLARYEQPEAWVRKTAFRLSVRPEPAATLDAEDHEVVEALQRLSLPLQEALVLHHCLDLPVEEVAAHTGVTAGTVKSRLARGRERLAELLRPAAIGGAAGTAPKEERHARR